MRRTKKQNAPFRSPVARPSGNQNVTAGQGTVMTKAETEALQKQIAEVNDEICRLEAEGYKQSELKEHIEKLHEYNEIKDVAQMVIGRLATHEGLRTRDLYAKYGLELED